MPKISSFGALPDPSPRVAATPGKAALASAAQKSAPASPQATDEAQASPLQAQLTRLSSVLNTLQTSAAASSAHFDAVSNQVKSGTYNVDSLDISKSIVSDLLSNH